MSRVVRSNAQRRIGAGVRAGLPATGLSVNELTRTHLAGAHGHVRLRDGQGGPQQEGQLDHRGDAVSRNSPRGGREAVGMTPRKGPSLLAGILGGQ
eukprot:scaffold51612_cov37-Tisochrysis_lutea.AAC.2